MRLTISLALVLLVGLSSCTRNPQRNKNDSHLLWSRELKARRSSKPRAIMRTKKAFTSKSPRFLITNLFEKELIDLKARTGAYDLIMLDDPWFPRFANEQLLMELGPLLQKRGQSGPDSDFVDTSVALCRHPYRFGITLCPSLRRQLAIIFLSQRSF